MKLESAQSQSENPSPQFKECPKHPGVADGKCKICEQEDRNDRRVKYLKIPPRVFDWRKKFEDGHPAKSLNETWEDVIKKHGAIILTGPRGIGKSAWACSKLFENKLCYEIKGCNWDGRFPLQGKEGCLFTSLIGMVGNIRATWNGNGDEREAIKEYSEYPLLVVDEVGVQARSENEKVLLYEVLVSRYENYRPTILTTNLDPSNKQGELELTACIGTRVWDRLMGGWINCNNWPRCRE